MAKKKRKSGKFSRDKGGRGEREFIALLKKYLGCDNIARNLQQTRNGGHDITTDDCAELESFAIEVKRVEARQLGAWWAQAERQAVSSGRRPLLAYRKNGEDWRIMLEMTPQDFAVYALRLCNDERRET